MANWWEQTVETVKEAPQKAVEAVNNWWSLDRHFPKEEQPIVNTNTLTDADVKLKESNNDPLAENPNSTARGLYQMTDDARQEAIKFNPELKDKDYNDPLVQEEYRKAYNAVLTNQLSTKGVKTTPDNLNRAWVIGAEGMFILKDADPNDLLKAVLPKSFFGKDGEKNPNLNNKTVKEFMNDPDPYSRK
tara:strand:+ start:107 stop:673 length:567 start_codon:yes stop_codon:yes gene_type:complete